MINGHELCTSLTRRISSLTPFCALVMIRSGTHCHDQDSSHALRGGDPGIRRGTVKNWELARLEAEHNYGSVISDVQVPSN